MTQEQAILATLVVYKIALVGIGVATSKKTHDGTDFFLGGRKLGAWVAALSASASSSSAWTLLGVSGAAYAWGLSAIWLFPACVGGFVINWFFLAERLRAQSRESQALTVSEFLAGPPGTPFRRAVGALGSVIVVFSLATYVATQFQGAGKTFSQTFGLGEVESVLIGATVIVVYTLLGGFWAVSITDTLQGALMALTATILPLAALAKVGGPAALWQAMQNVPVEGYAELLQGMPLMAGVGFAIGLLGIGLGYPGQPHVANRFMALEDAQGVRRGRWVALVWGVLVYSGMLAVGWCGRVLVSVDDKEKIFMALTSELFPPVIAGIMIAAVLSAVMSTADSQLLVVVSSLTHDLDLDASKPENLLQRSRVVIVTVSIVAVWAALKGPPEIFSFVLVAWTALGASFGPLLLVRVWRGPVHPVLTLIAMGLGFSLALITYSLPAEFKGGILERVVPFAASFLVALVGSFVPCGDQPSSSSSR